MFKIKYIRNSFLVGLLLIGFLSFSQSQKDSVQFKLDINLSGRKISGTFKQLVVGGGFNVDVLYNNWHLENTTTYRYNKTNTRVIEDNWYDLIMLKYYPNGKKKFYPGAFYHFDNSLVYRVKKRHQYGIGIGSLLDKGAMKLSVLAGIANEHSTFNGTEFVNSDRDFSLRKNGLFLFKLNNGYALVNKKINLSYQVFYFQSLKESTDYDIWLTARVNFKIIKSLSVHMVYDYRFENVHLEGLSHYNDIVLFGLNWKIQG